MWAAHTHIVQQAEQTPYISSPKKQSGKSRLLDALELVVANP